MAKLKKQLSYISVPSQIINSLSSSSLQSLLVSPKKSSKSSFSKKFFTFNTYKKPRFWFLTLFLVGLFGMLKLGLNLDPLIPLSPYPCFTRNPQDSFASNDKSHLSFASNNGKKDEILKGVNESQALMGKGLGDLEEQSEFWKQPDGMGYRPCLAFSREYRKQSNGIVKDRRKYLLVVVSGGMNQQRNQIVDAVVIARILGAALVVPILQVNVIWGDESEFSDIFDMEHFKRVLANDVRVVSSLPSTHIMTRPVEEKRTPLHVSPQWIRARYLRRLNREGVLLLRGLDSRLSKDLPSDLQKLRCKVAFHALRFAPPILQLGNKLAERMHSKGPYLALHLRMEKDVWVRTGCLPGPEYDEIGLQSLTYSGISSVFTHTLYSVGALFQGIVCTKMSARGGKVPNAAANYNPSVKGKYVTEVSNTQVEHLSGSVADISLDSAQDDGGWEVYARKSKNKAGSSAAKSFGSQNSNYKAWGHPDVIQKPGVRGNGGSGRAPAKTWTTQNADSKIPAGRVNARPQITNRAPETNNMAAQTGIHSPLEHGWNWQSRAGSSFKHSENSQDQEISNLDKVHKDDVDDDYDDENDDDSDVLDDSDYEFLSDEFDSDASQKSHETRKKIRCFKKFFESLDSLTVEEINEPARQWHCPVCQGGPGAIDWYRGLQPLMTHAKTKGGKRVRLHRELADLLDEELRRRGTSIIPAGEVFGKWKGLKDIEKDHEIVWPPMVIIMNTRLDKDENDKWIGMGNQELLEYFNSYAAVRARHSYGPQGHRGISVLIFEGSAGGYLEAERLHKHFSEQGTDRDAWNNSNRRVLFHPGGKRQLYGFMALKEDFDIFNQHYHGKTKLKFEMKSYHEMVVNQIRQMSEDNQHLVYLKNRVVKEQRHSKALEETFGIVSEKLRETMEENRIVKQRTKMQHEQNKEEMDFQEQLFKDQIKIIHEARDAKEENFEKLQKQERERVEQSIANPTNTKDYKLRAEEIAKLLKVQDKEIEDFVAARDMLIKLHGEKMDAMRRRHWEEEVESEKEFDAKLTQLMEKYSPHGAEVAAKPYLMPG